MLVITDNGSNMVKAFKSKFARVTIELPRLDEEDSDEDDELLDTEDVEVDDSGITLPRLPCVVHTIQLVVNIATKAEVLKPVLTSARKLVEKIRRSSVATQKLKENAGKTVVLDCPTRWSSTYLMIDRLLALKAQVNEVCFKCVHCTTECHNFLSVHND